MNTDEIRDRNDRVRNGKGIPVVDIVVLSDAIKSMQYKSVITILYEIAKFDNLTKGNDPYGEHDFAALTVCDKNIMFKIDRFDKDLKMHGTDRFVMTVMLEEEY